MPAPSMKINLRETCKEVKQEETDILACLKYVLGEMPETSREQQHRGVFREAFSERYLQIEHVHQLLPVLDDDMIVVVHKEVLHPVGSDKAALFIKVEGRGSLARAHKQGRALEVFAVVHNILNETSAIAPALGFGSCRKVLDFEDAFALSGHNADGLHIGITEGKHCAPVEISFNHVHLFVCQEQQIRKVELLFFGDGDEMHGGSCRCGSCGAQHTACNGWSIAPGALRNAGDTGSANFRNNVSEIRFDV